MVCIGCRQGLVDNPDSRKKFETLGVIYKSPFIDHFWMYESWIQIIVRVQRSKIKVNRTRPFNVSWPS